MGVFKGNYYANNTVVKKVFMRIDECIVWNSNDCEKCTNC